MSSSGMWRSFHVLRTDVSKEYIVSIFRVGIILELGTTLAVTSALLNAGASSSRIIPVLKMEATNSNKSHTA
jgi:hypothetical protein